MKSFIFLNFTLNFKIDSNLLSEVEPNSHKPTVVKRQFGWLIMEGVKQKRTESQKPRFPLPKL